MIVGFMFGLTNLSIDHEGWAYCLMADRCRKDHWKLIAQERYVNWETGGLGDGGMAYGGEAAWSYQVPEQQERAVLADYVIPDEFLLRVREQQGGALAASVYLQQQDDAQLTGMLEHFFDDMQAKGDKIEAVVTYPKTVHSLVTVVNRRGIRLLVFEAGPLRFPGYLGTAFLCEGDPHWADRCGLERRYQEFYCLWPETSDRLLSGREILAVMLRDEYLAYLRLYGAEPQWEALVCGNYMADPLTMGESSVTPLELLEQAKKDYGDQFYFRPDPGDLLHVTFGLPQERIDLCRPNILSLTRSRQVLAIFGNIMLDALLWGKTVHGMEKKSDLYPYCQSGEAASCLLNYYIFAYLAPMELATTDQYVRWRLTGPDEMELYQYHLDYYLGKYGLDRSVFALEEQEAVQKIVSARGASVQLAQPLARADGETLDAFWKRAEEFVGYQKIPTAAERIAAAQERADRAQEQCMKAQEAVRQEKERGQRIQEELEQTQAQVRAAQQQVTQAQTQTTQAQQQVTQAQTQAAQARQEAEQAYRSKQQMQQQAAQAQAGMQAVLDSNSWRVTAPLRKLRQAAGGLWKRE